MYKKATALALATTITLLTGCTGAREETESAEPQETIQPVESQEAKQPVEFYLSDEQEELAQAKSHRHAIVYFGEQAVILRECEQYDIIYAAFYSDTKLGIDYKNSVMAVWRTQEYNLYNTNHVDLLAKLENAAIEKGAKVLKIQPQNSK